MGRRKRSHCLSLGSTSVSQHLGSAWERTGQLGLLRKEKKEKHKEKQKDKKDEEPQKPAPEPEPSDSEVLCPESFP